MKKVAIQGVKGCFHEQAAYLFYEKEGLPWYYAWGKSQITGDTPIQYLAPHRTITGEMAKAGYECALSGKWHIGDSATPQAGYTYWKTIALGGDNYFYPMMLVDGKINMLENEYVTDVITDNAIEFLDTRDKEKPFFLSVSYTAPHSPWSAVHHKKEYIDMYKDYRSIEWLGDNNYFYLTRLSRDLHRVDVCKVTLGDDTARVVIEERLNTYIETRSLREVKKTKELIQWSERNGWAHLYLYGADGKLKNAITKGAWHVEDVVAVDEAARVVYFTAHGVNKKENPYYAHLYRINFDGTGMKLLNDGNFDNMTFMCDDAKFFVIYRSDMQYQLLNMYMHHLFS